MDEGFDGISIIDRMKVSDRIARYSWAIDSADLNSYLDCFDEKGTLRHPLPDGSPGSWTGHEGIEAFIGKGFRNRREQSYGHQHHITAVRLTPEGENIRVDAYASVFRHDLHRQYWPRGASWRLGTWHALLGRAGATWKILDLDVRMWTDTALSAGEALLPRAPGLPGTRD